MGRGSATIGLPRHFQWFARDFGRGSAIECAHAAARYMEGEQRTRLLACLSGAADGSLSLSVHYLPFDFSCR